MTIDLVGFNLLTRRIIGSAIEVHRHLGPGLLESSYQECLARELALRRLSFRAQQSAPVIYKGVRLSASYRLDLIVEGVVVVEVKSVASINAVHHAQALTYMRIADCPVGLLINFNVPRLIDGVKRLVNAGARGGQRPADCTELTEAADGYETTKGTESPQRSRGVENSGAREIVKSDDPTG